MAQAQDARRRVPDAVVGLLLGVALAGLVVVLAGWFRPLAATASPATVTPMVTVAVGVDFGPQSSRPPAAACVELHRGESAAAAIVALARSLGFIAPTWDSSWPGFLCSIDALPSRTTACLSNFSSASPNWAYFQGRGRTWHYATVGAAGDLVENHALEAWRLEPGGAPRSAIERPRLPANFASLCRVVSAESSTVQRTTGTSAGVGLVAAAVLAGLLVVLAFGISRRRSQR